ncbi:DUF3046 domain-containing protein [Luteipulveratus mongoliensis]|uniref:Histidine kinase n=1 Tax=Luteipulveratus mongoliensis TaxID=571913 RepID=A0A0K1JL54_9MICO|nr:DUF3046 domain-containing protein [Luteipulveratus mongoliensis]AKU17300.1 histidine kinase [Luteipulveratus mongoliensis]
MRMSEFWRLMDDEFGASYSRMLARTHMIHALGDLTVDEALEARHKPREVWLAMCADMGVPPERLLGKDVPVRENPKEL